jgi:hypothetical protein
MQTDIIERERVQRMEQWEELIDLLERADVIQQRMVDDEKISYDLHQRIQLLADEIEDLAAKDEQSFNE